MTTPRVSGFNPQYLPTSRREYVSNHAETTMANLHANDGNIAPTWTKITVTPFSGKAAICSGYGRRLQNTSISDDVPRYFLNPDRVERPTNYMSKESARVTKLMKSDSKDTLPGGESMRNALTNPPSDQHKRFRSYPHDSFRIKPQMYMEPLVTTRPGERISKNPITQSTEGRWETSDVHNCTRIPLSTWAKA